MFWSFTGGAGQFGGVAVAAKKGAYGNIRAALTTPRKCYQRSPVWPPSLTPSSMHWRKIVGSGRVLTDADSLQRYGRDWTRVYTPNPAAIVLPGSIEQVQAIVRLAASEALAIVPSGGRTGLSAGAVACNGELVLALDRLNSIEDFNPVDRTVRCGAGVVTGQLQDYAAHRDLFYPVDFASSGSSQIGGNISTNAGGIKVIRHGMTRDWVAGLKLVTGTGEVLDLNRGLVKNNAGYDLRQLVIGAEGTLGVVVEATMRLSRPRRSWSCWCSAHRTWPPLCRSCALIRGQWSSVRLSSSPNWHCRK